MAAKTEDDGSGNRFEELIGFDQTPCFAVRRTIISGEVEKSVTEGFIGIVTEGEGLACNEGNDTELKLWDRFFCPAGVENLRYRSREGMTVVECYAGKK